MGTEDRTTEGTAERWTRKGKEIFSKEALDKMRSPEKLDTVLPITSPVSWMGLIAVAAMLFAVVLWSIARLPVSPVRIVGLPWPAIAARRLFDAMYMASFPGHSMSMVGELSTPISTEPATIALWS